MYERALELLAPLRDPRSVPALRAALYRGEWWSPGRTMKLRRYAAAALARIDTADARAVLTEAAASGPRSAKTAAKAELDAVARQPRSGGRS